MNLKTILLFGTLLLGQGGGSYAQFHAGNSFIVKANTPFAIDSVTLQPSVDLSLSGNELTTSYIPATNAPQPGASISRVASFVAPFSYQGSVGLYYSNSQLNGNSAALLHLVYHMAQSGYTNTNLVQTSNSNNHVVATTGLQSIIISKLTATNTGTVLPLQLLSFTALKKGQSTYINWETSNEISIDHFEVEKSTDATSFQSIFTTPAGRNDYHTVDDEPLKGWTYYRLKIVNENGEIDFSNVAGIYFDAWGPTFALYPNPMGEQLLISIYATEAKELAFSLLTLDGKVAKSGILKIKEGENSFSVDCSNLPAGNYYFRTTDGFTGKIVKQ